MVEEKLRTDVYIFSGVTGASVTPEKCVPIKNINMKSLAISTPRKDTILNQDIKRLLNKKYPSLSPHFEKYPP